MTHRRVSVIIPVYNVVSFLSEAIQSVLSQDYPNTGIVIVDDGSPMEASAKIADICRMSENISLVKQSNKGQAQARRTGVLHADGEYVMFLDADDTLLPGAISYLVAALENHPSAIASYGRKVVTENGGFKHLNILPAENDAISGDVLPALLTGVPLLSNGSICIYRHVALKIKFPENIWQGEDWVTWCRLALLGDIIYAGIRPVLCVRLHGESMSGQVFAKPASLMGMIDMIFSDQDILAHVGKRKLEEYRIQHILHIHAYLRVNYTQRRRHLMAFKHKILCRMWGRKLLTYRDDFLNAQFPEKAGKIRVLHIVKWFYAGGAERLLSSLLKYSDKGRYEHIILSLSSQNERLSDIQHTLNIPYYAIEIPREGNNLGHYLKCLRFISKARPDIIKTWLPSCNIPGGIMGNILRIPVIWGVHDSQPPQYKNAIRQIYLSGIVPSRIVCCSEPVRAICLKTGFRASKLEVIVNGTDTEIFNYQAEGRKRVRSEFGIGDNTILIGMAAEHIPIKRHMHFLLAARILIESHPDAHFLFCGKNTDADNPVLKNGIEFLGIQKHVHLLGIRNDMADIYSALDIHTLNSTAESFGLAVTEAMACKTLCVATNVGMMKDLLRDVGEIIPSSAPPPMLAEAWKRMLDLNEQEKNERREKGRKRIKEQYSVAETAKRYDALYHSIHSQFVSDV